MPQQLVQQMFDSEGSQSLLESLSDVMSKERDGAIEARKQSGLDDAWRSSREQFQGIDEVNRGRPRVSKSRSLDDSITTTLGRVEQEDRSTVFVNITRPYTNAGTAHVADILLPTGGKRNWDLRSTPVSETALLVSFIVENPDVQEALPAELQEYLAQSGEQRDGSIKEARTIIEDWLTETQWHNHTRKQIVESGKVGTGVIKGPFPKRRKLSQRVESILALIPQTIADPDLAALYQEKLRVRLLYQPTLECIPVENCYPDMPSCGDSIQNGRFFWEEIPNVSRTELQDALEDESYFVSQLQRCLDEDPLPNNAKGESTNKKKKSYTRWRRTGEIDLRKFISESELEGPPIVWIEQEIINDRVVKVSLPALDTKKFPYRLLLWEARQDSWAGIGLPEQIETPQRGLNAAVRAGNDNMGWSVGFQIILGKGIEAMQGSSDKLERYKIWRDTTDQLTALSGKERSAKDAMATIEFPNHLDRILPWIDFWLRMAESTTNLSLLLQGQAQTSAVGTNQMLMNSSTTNLRMFVKHWDDDNCSPIIQDMYGWVQKYGPESARGDAVAQALGSSVLIVRDLQQQALVQLLDRFVQPVYGKSPKKGMDLFLESLQFDPRQLDLDEEEKQQLEAASAEPDPKVQVEMMRTQSDQMIAQLKDQTDRIKLMLDAQLKGMSLDQAADAIETQAAGNLALESLKQEGEVEKESGVKAVPVSEPVVEEEPSIEESLNILGIRG